VSEHTRESFSFYAKKPMLALCPGPTTILIANQALVSFSEAAEVSLD
jgi:hypothetical protein